MLDIYLWFNAVLYVLLALWCTIAPTATARAQGYSVLAPSGLSEYLVVYGGLQLGLGLYFAWCAHAGAQRAGLVLAVLLYAPIVLYRCASVARNWPVGSTTLVVGSLELVLLAAALWLYARQPG